MSRRRWNPKEEGTEANCVQTMHLTLREARVRTLQLCSTRSYRHETTGLGSLGLLH